MWLLTSADFSNLHDFIKHGILLYEPYEAKLMFLQFIIYLNSKGVHSKVLRKPFMKSANISSKRDTKVLLKSVYIQKSSQRKYWINSPWSSQLITAWLNLKYSREHSSCVTLKSMCLLEWKQGKKKLALFFSSSGFVEHDEKSHERGLSPLIFLCLKHSLEEQ